MTLNISPADNNRRRNAGINARLPSFTRFYLAKAHTKDREKEAESSIERGVFSLDRLSLIFSISLSHFPSFVLFFLYQNRSVSRARREIDFLDAFRWRAERRDRQSGREIGNQDERLILKQSIAWCSTPYGSSHSPLFVQLSASRNIGNRSWDRPFEIYRSSEREREAILSFSFEYRVLLSPLLDDSFAIWRLKSDKNRMS